MANNGYRQNYLIYPLEKNVLENAGNRMFIFLINFLTD